MDGYHTHRVQKSRLVRPVKYAQKTRRTCIPAGFVV